MLNHIQDPFSVKKKENSNWLGLLFVLKQFIQVFKHLVYENTFSLSFYTYTIWPNVCWHLTTTFQLPQIAGTKLEEHSCLLLLAHQGAQTCSSMTKWSSMRKDDLLKLVWKNWRGLQSAVTSTTPNTWEMNCNAHCESVPSHLISVSDLNNALVAEWTQPCSKL